MGAAAKWRARPIRWYGAAVVLDARTRRLCIGLAAIGSREVANTHRHAAEVEIMRQASAVGSSLENINQKEAESRLRK
jgi:hypothetical protein